MLLPYITRQRLHLPAADFLRLVTERSVALPPSHHLPTSLPPSVTPSTLASVPTPGAKLKDGTAGGARATSKHCQYLQLKFWLVGGIAHGHLCC